MLAFCRSVGFHTLCWSIFDPSETSFLSHWIRGNRGLFVWLCCRFHPRCSFSILFLKSFCFSSASPASPHYLNPSLIRVRADGHPSYILMCKFFVFCYAATKTQDARITNFFNFDALEVTPIKLASFRHSF